MVVSKEGGWIVTSDVQAQAMTQSTREQSELLSSWRAHAAAAQHAHYLLVGWFGRANLWLGILAVITSAIVGTSLFATLGRREGGDPAYRDAVRDRVPQRPSGRARGHADVPRVREAFRAARPGGRLVHGDSGRSM